MGFLAGLCHDDSSQCEGVFLVILGEILVITAICTMLYFLNRFILIKYLEAIEAKYQMKSKQRKRRETILEV